MSAAHPLALPPVVARLASAAPELTAASTYLVAWVAPARLEPGLARLLLLGLLVEFLVIHSFAFTVLGVDGIRGRGKKSLAILGFSAFYLLFAGAFALAFSSSAPLWTLGWLFGSRLLTLWVDPRPRGEERQRQSGLWAASAALYIFGVALTSILPLPRLGVGADVVAALSLPGSGLWVEEPHRLFAFGLIYFGGVAAVELRGG